MTDLLSATVPTPDSASALNVRKAKVSFGLKLGYSAGQLVEGVINNALSVFLLFYATAVCGLSGGLAGAALSVGMIVDAVMDPLIGSLSDGWRSRLGRRLPFMMCGLAPIAISFGLIFSLPHGLGQLPLFLWMAALSIILRISLSLFILPYQAIGAELSDDYVERSEIMAWRWAVGQTGALAAVALGFGLFFNGKAGLSARAAYGPFALSLAAIFVAGGLVALRVAYLTRDRQHPPAVPDGRFLRSLVSQLGEIFRNRSFLILFAGALLFFIALGVFAALGLHANTFFWRLNAAQAQLVTLGLFGGLLAGAPLAGPFLRRFEKRTILAAGMLGLMVAQGGPATLRLTGLLPLAGEQLTLVLAAVNFIGGGLMAAAAIAFSSMMADAADEHEYLFGARREGLFFAGWAFASKAAGGAGALIAGLVLQVIHFPTDLAQHGGTAAALPASMVNLLGLFYGPGAALLTLAAVVVNQLYRLDRQAHAAVLVALQARASLPQGAS
jgi:GPH family glycoside/pentoside/hexuronide:cation symporter